MKALFIHRSVGRHLIDQGNLRELLLDRDILLDDYDNNSGVLTCSDNSESNNSIVIPGNNTNPANLAQFFTTWPDALDDYDLIIIKSCYPNSHIKSHEQLDNIKDSYNSIIKAFANHAKQPLILTSPPLRPILTNQTEAQFSIELADWLASSSGVHVFDLHKLLIESSGKHKGMLKQRYRRLIPFDNHPNRKAHEVIAPPLAKAINDAILQ